MSQRGIVRTLGLRDKTTIFSCPAFRYYKFVFKSYYYGFGTVVSWMPVADALSDVA